MWEKWFHDLSSHNKIILSDGTQFWCAFDNVHLNILFQVFHLDVFNKIYRYNANTVHFFRMISQRKTCLYSCNALKWLALYSFTDNNVVIDAEGQCSILHEFAGHHVRTQTLLNLSGPVNTRLKKVIFRPQIFMEKISKFRKQWKMGHFCDPVVKWFFAHMYQCEVVSSEYWCQC